MKCPSTEALLAQPELSQSEHVLSCPRCAARQRALAEFLNPSAAPGDVSIAEVEAELRQRLARSVAAHSSSSAVRQPRTRAIRPLRYLTLAAAVAATLLLVVRFRPTESAENGAVRSTTAQQTAKLALSESSSWNGSTLQLAWNPIEGADRYLVIVYNSQLGEIASQEVKGVERCSVTLSGQSSSRSLWVRVRALKAVGVLEDSGLQIVVAPK